MSNVLMPAALGAVVLCAAVVMTTDVIDAQARRPPAKAKAAKAAPEPNPTVSLVGLQVVGKSLGKGRFRDAVAFESRQGVSLALAVKVEPGTAILEIDDDECTVETWTDDKGTDLNIEPDWGSFPTYTEDMSAGIISVRSPLVPASGAQQVSMAGSLAVTTAAGTQSSRATKVTLTKGTTFKAGALAGTISEFEASDSGGSVSVRFTGPTAGAIKEVRFLDAAGTVIESDRNGSMTSSDEVELMYTLKAKAASATLEVEVWQNLKTSAVPFTISAGLGSIR